MRDSRKLKEYLCIEFARIRTELGITQEQMAERLDMSVRSYANIEACRSLCSAETLILFLVQNTPYRDRILNDLEHIILSDDPGS